MTAVDTRPAFDSVDIPARSLIDACVHCGFCLPTCPTYVLWSEEMDSPRGRIYLMKAGLEGRTTLTPSFVRHFDRCLGCMACVAACPSGVQYGPLIERTRAQIERRYSRALWDRAFRALLFALLPYPRRLRVALAPLALLGWLRRASADFTRGASHATPSPGRDGDPGVRLASRTRQGSRHSVAKSALRPSGFPPGSQAGLLGRLRALVRLAPRVRISGLLARAPEHTPAAGAARMHVAVLTGCVQRLVFPQVNEATINVLAAEGCSVAAPGAQGCCGALSLHAGNIDQARELARHNIAVFERTGADRIAVNAAGCGSCMKEYGELFADDPDWSHRARALGERVRDVSEVLVELGEPRARRQPMHARVAYHDACHLAHAQGIRSQPRELLAAIPGVELVTPAEPEICCGSAGIYNLVEPEAAADLGARKARQIAALAPDVIATANPGCMLQIAAAGRRLGHNWRIVHPIELLDASIRGDRQPEG